MTELYATDVFTPNTFPKHTYVKREDGQFERRLMEALETPGGVVSVSGPSKAGKTVLVEEAVGQDLITICGNGIRNADDIWAKVLDRRNEPTSQTETSTTGRSCQRSRSMEGQINILVGKGGVGGRTGVDLSHGMTNSKTFSRRGLDQVVDEIADGKIVLLIDDFHYMDRPVQMEVAKHIKEAASRGVKICTMLGPHRSDDVVRSNPELRGRLRAINITYWKPKELEEIARVGFPKLNLTVKAEIIRRFASEASGSPQLMQAICLQTCHNCGISKQLERDRELEINDDEVDRILKETFKLKF